jgi:hypothetical protein
MRIATPAADVYADVCAALGECGLDTAITAAPAVRRWARRVDAIAL